MPTLYALCGLAFSGKSTVARRIAQTLEAPIVSLDAINRARGLDGGAYDGMTDAQWEETSWLAVARLAELMRAGTAIVLDDTLSHRFLRDRYRRVAAENGYDMLLVYLDSPLLTIEARRRANDCTPARARIDEAVFARHRDGFQHPDESEPLVRLRSAADLDLWIGTLGAAPSANH